MEIDVPDGNCMSIEEYIGGELPGNWAFVEEQSRRLGTDWLRERRAMMLSVPSVVIPFERNLLLNPLHPSFSMVRLVEVRPFFFDARIFGPNKTT